tara:strand:- start:696 stop:890 length:195 start_codon:yes stop_codon:yes gene_type:complete
MVVTEKALKKAAERLKERKKLEKIWTRFKMARRIARRNGKKLPIEVFDKMVKDELGIDDWRSSE